MIGIYTSSSLERVDTRSLHKKGGMGAECLHRGVGTLASPLHFLLNKRRIDDVALTNTRELCLKLRRKMKLLRVGIPYLNDVKSSLGANRDSIRAMFRRGGGFIQDARDRIGQKDVADILLGATKGVASSANMVMALPQRWRGVTHQKEHPLGKGFHPKTLHDIPKVTPVGHGAERQEGLKRPFRLFGGVKIEGPGSCREGGVEGDRRCFLGSHRSIYS